jgi:hypothetical protein
MYSSIQTPVPARISTEIVMNELCAMFKAATGLFMITTPIATNGWKSGGGDLWRITIPLPCTR